MTRVASLLVLVPLCLFCLFQGSKAVATRSQLVPSSDGALIYAEATGNSKNPALILIHGFSLSTIVFDKQFDDNTLQKELYLIRYDTRGHGRSAKPSTLEGYASNLFADDFVAVCKAFGVVKPFVAGWSLGASVINDILANLPPNTISGAILMAGAPSISLLDPPVLTDFVLGLIPGITSTNDTALYKSSAITFGNGLFVDPESIPFEVRMAWLGLGVLQPPNVTVFVNNRQQDPAKVIQAGQEGFPFLAMAGAHDRLVNMTTLVSILRQDGFTNLRTVTLDAGHAFFFERPKETNQILLAFISARHRSRTHHVQQM